MGKILSALLLALFGTQAFAADCLHRSEGRYFQVIMNTEKAEVWLQENPDRINEFNSKYGSGSAQAVLDDRYVDYLIEVGCSNHVKDGQVVPVTDTIKMKRHSLDENVLTEICAAFFPKTWDTNEGELYVTTEHGILRYRGTECALFKFQ